MFVAALGLQNYEWWDLKSRHVGEQRYPIGQDDVSCLLASKPGLHNAIMGPQAAR